MDFITPEEITTLGLTAEQMAVLTPKYNTHFADSRKQWEGTANTNAENILAGAVKAIQNKLGITEERAQGEKVADYMARVSESHVSGLKASYDEKIKNFKGDDATKAELLQAQSALDTAKKQLAGYDDIVARAAKYDDAAEKLSGLKLSVAFTDVKPVFSDSVNAYEAKAKWDEFKATVLAKHTIEIVDGVSMAIDKENQYKTAKLSDLVAADEALTELVKGRQQPGTGAKPAGKSTKIEGLSFEVPEDVKTNAAERAKLIRAQLATEGVAPMAKDYAIKFSDYNAKIMAAK